MFNLANPAQYMADHLGGLVAGFAIYDVMIKPPIWLAVAVAGVLDTLTDSLATSYELWLLVSGLVVLGFGVMSAVLYPRVDRSRCNRKVR